MSGPTPILELSCLAIIAFYLVFRVKNESNRARFCLRLAWLTVASWIAEDTCIHAYGFYGYHPDWTLFIDRVPILIVLIWPMVIHTAWDLARFFTRHRPALRRHLPLITALLVLTDASLIEPIAASAHLWAWSEPGLFAVPPIGIIGWALFAGFAVPFLERDLVAPRARSLWLTVLIPTLVVHPALLALWWGLLRWVNAPIPSATAATVAWVCSITLAALALVRRAGRDLPPLDLIVRIPAAAFFFVLLTLITPPDSLISYALAFTVPYLLLTIQSFTGKRRPT